jgi:DNA-binding FadR family transcriptional regulator
VNREQQAAATRAQLEGVVRPAARGLPRTVKRSELLASEIVEEIITRQMTTGDVLPPESVMLDNYGVGRASLREALRLLEAQGLVSLKPGPGGGPVVGRVDPVNLGRTASLYFRLAGASYGVLAEAMTVLEPWLAELAAQRSDRSTVEATLGPCLASAEALAGDENAVFGAAPEFHEAVFSLGGNPVLETVASAVGAIFRLQVLRQVDLLADQPRFLESHRDIARAIAAGQATKAKRLAEDHMQDIIAVVNRQKPDLLGRSIEWR